ncbi:MAG: hypothetical protein KDM63_15650 [Verrucomicrobiae bacterium]|nr:hypothetical protein [Verrucomicrobiae bacterium]
MRRPILPCLIAGVTLLGGLACPAQEAKPAAPGTEFKHYRAAQELILSVVQPEQASQGPSDPFAAPVAGGGGSTESKVPELEAFLTTELGIEFPEGTWVTYDTKTGALEICHQPAVVKAIETYFDQLDTYGSRQISIRVEIYQMPSRAALKIQQLCGPMDDHAPIWETVQAMLEKGQATLVTTLSTLARSGQRSKASDVREFIYATEVDWDEKQEAVIPAAFETRDVGSIFEVDPVIGGDDYTIDLNFSLEHHTVPPVMQPTTVTSPKTGKVVVVEMPEFHSKRITTQITMRDGSTKCVGAWRPTGKPEFETADVMQVAFLRTDLQRMKLLVPIP